MIDQKVKASVDEVILEIAELHNIDLPPLEDHQAIVDDLGFTSLRVAELIANLEDKLGIDPFQDEEVSITDIRTLKDIYNVYSSSLEQQTTEE